jgi:hypothetical protein
MLDSTAPRRAGRADAERVAHDPVRQLAVGARHRAVPGPRPSCRWSILKVRLLLVHPRGLARAASPRRRLSRNRTASRGPAWAPALTQTGPHPAAPHGRRLSRNRTASGGPAWAPALTQTGPHPAAPHGRRLSPKPDRVRRPHMGAGSHPNRTASGGPTWAPALTQTGPHPAAPHGRRLSPKPDRTRRTISSVSSCPSAGFAPPAGRPAPVLGLRPRSHEARVSGDEVGAW